MLIAYHRAMLTWLRAALYETVQHTVFPAVACCCRGQLRKEFAPGHSVIRTSVIRTFDERDCGPAGAAGQLQVHAVPADSVRLPRPADQRR